MGDTAFGQSDFVYGPIADTNLQDRQARVKDRSDESADVHRDLRDVSRHAGVGNNEAEGVHSAGPFGDAIPHDDAPQHDAMVALADLKGRGNADKPALQARENYVGPSGVGSGSLVPNTPEGVSGPETLSD